MTRRSLAFLAAALLALALAAPARAEVTLPEHFEDVTLAEGFFVPTALAYAPDGRIFVAQLFGRVFVVEDGQVHELLDIEDHVNVHNDQGLIGMAVDADFATNHYLYLLYTYEVGDDRTDDGPKTARLTRVVVNDDNTVANPGSPETVILGKEDTAPCGTPSNELDCIPADSGTHTIGTVRADPDGTLWVGSGDASPPVPNADGALRAYDERSYAGKIMHIDREGNGRPGHPFCPADDDLTHVCTKVYAKGFRNPYRFALRGGGLGPVVGDVGFNTAEELDLVEPGKDYGWPCWEAGGHTPGWTSNPACVAYYKGPAPAAPAWHYGNGPGAAIVGGPAYPGGPYPDSFDGKFLVGDYAQGWIKLLTVGSGSPTVEGFATGAGPLDLQLSPEHNIAYTAAEELSFNGRLAEIRYCPVNCGPVARVSADTTFGDAPLTVKLDGSKSFDWDDDDTLTYDWDFGDGSPHSALKSPAHTYADDGLFTAKLTVTDPHGKAASRSIQIWSANNAPVPTIEAPADGSAFKIGTLVQLKGSARDREDGELDPAQLEWNIVLHHNTHIHPFDSATGATTELSPASDHDADSWYEVTLTARDSQGLRASRTIRLWPSTVPVRLTSTPPGAPLSWAGSAVVAPFAAFSPLGFETFVSAASVFTRGSRTYTFESWSDGKPAGHAVTVAGPGLRLVARYRDVTPPPPSDTTGPRLRFDPEEEGRHARNGRLAGFASDPAGVRRVDVALRTRRASKQGCRWWLRRFGRLGGGRSSCDYPRWIRAQLRLRKAGVRWRAELGGAAPARRYVVAFRAVDKLGNVTRRPEGLHRVRISVPR